MDKLTQKYNYVHQPFNIAPVIGEFDDPFNQRQGILTLPISTEGNTIIYGSAGSGKEQMLNAIIYNTITNHKAEEVNFYILEFGAESLRIFSKAPHVGDILYINDSEKINNLFKMLKGEVDRRKKLFSDFSGDYQTYIKSSGNTVPTFVVIINNYEAFNEVYASYEDIILQLTREGSKYGLFFLFTTSASNMIRYRLAQNFGQKLVLRLNDESDYSSILGNVRGTKPSDIMGRGLINLGSIYEFQTASIVPEEQLNETIRKTCDDLRASSTYKAKSVPILPEKVTFNYVRDSFNGITKLPVGIEKKSLDVSTVNLKKGYVTMLTSLDVVILKSIVNQIGKEINMLKETRFIAIDTEELIENDKLDRCEFVNNNLDEVFTKLCEEMKSVQEAFQNSNFDKNSIASVPETVIFISGLDKFMTKLSPENKRDFGKLFEYGKELDKYAFLLIDSVDKFKKVEYDDWYRSTVNNTRGIWVGDGIANQFSIKLTKTTKDLYEEIGNRFGYVVERGIPTLIKLLEDGNGDE